MSHLHRQLAAQAALEAQAADLEAKDRNASMVSIIEDTARKNGRNYRRRKKRSARRAS